MKPEEVVKSFFQGLKTKNYKSVQSLYGFNSFYSDEVFPSLAGSEIGKMWEMRFSLSKDFNLDYKILKSSSKNVEVKWDIKYKPKDFNKYVENSIRTTFEIQEGKIITQKDRFNFPKWVKNTRGTWAYLFCFLGITRKKIQERAEFTLNAFILKNS